jgi:hypothetical protein
MRVFRNFDEASACFQKIIAGEKVSLLFRNKITVPVNLSDQLKALAKLKYSIDEISGLIY